MIETLHSPSRWLNARIFTEGPIARYSVALAERTPAALRRWGFVCATSLEDFKEAVRRFG